MSEAQPLTLAEGRLAALAWGDEAAPTWLALHGWLDNAASFSRLAPMLVARLGIRIVALDFAGHGHSSHREGDYALWDYCHDLLDAADELGLERVPLLAHSMGAGVACLTAAALPERVERLVLIDGLGAVTTPISESAAQLRKGLRAARRPRSAAPRYPESRTAIAARVAGGVTPIDTATATPLVERNLVREPDGHVRLRTDGRLLWPSPVRLSPEQALALLEAIQAPALLIEGEGGILGERDMARAARAAVSHLARRVLPGGHHLHLEPGSVFCVAETIEAWLASAE
ncbi:MAG: alpha/beta hydrolase [Halomonas sp.]|jgi:pimeloyl-ACP methyl ester carboxylesterase|uniref:alpha/beta fold hydrolase n=1 Tax=Halomonas sp. MCCC 1A11057 TaxID=2733482 RepID=UPI001F32C2F0|nr:alpha/beta fold hydrolase [Halomonas sp. MCCC 1A11057]MCE8034392.1 alpha/beta fold hydrolase [Halomonas sp. MCCC 1A11057]MDX5435014.1 alpha/beta hydrolase [Halomonas sp.]